jgi:3'-phosphoadenosine 5'-phosphosulfate sulfotransferase
VGVAWGLTACGGTLDAGWDRPHGLLPVDERNPIVISNDGPLDNWQGEYALLLANAGGPRLEGIVVNVSAAWPDIDSNIAGWREMVAAARASGMHNAPDPIASISQPLVRPADGNIDATVPNRSEGARLIVDAAERASRPYRPLVVATGGRLTDIADAYLLDHTLPERVVIVSSLGSQSAEGATMSNPNGEMDPWADTIVVEKFRYVQVSAFYDQTTDVPASRLGELPNNAFGAWMSAKQPSIWDLPEAADQVSVLAGGLPQFVLEVQRVSVAPGDSPTLVTDSAGSGWLVTRSDGALATTRFWQWLLAPAN